MKKFQGVLLCVLPGCSYGLVHDQITARVCLEYFSVAHPPLFPTSSVTLLALCWGELSQRHLLFLPPSLARAIPTGWHDRFLAVWCAHLASYLVGIIDAATLCYRTWQARGRPAEISLFPRNRLQAFRATGLAALAIYAVWHRFGR